MTLLTLHYPKLRILWCRDPAEAAEIFEELKANCLQPSVETAISIKTDQIGDNNLTKYNPILKVSKCSEMFSNNIFCSRLSIHFLE